MGARQRCPSATRLVSVLHYDGTPITARFIAEEIGRHVRAMSRSAQHAAE